MKKILLPFFAASIMVWGCADNQKTETTAETTSSEDAAVDKTEVVTPAPMPDSATAMKNWQDYSTPGDMHKMMEKMAGNWSDSMTMWYDPSAPAQTTVGKSVYKMEMGNRYLVSKHTSNMMGMPFEGESTLAYDNARKVFINTWIDNMGTGIMVMEGKYDEGTKSIELKGKMVDGSRGDGTEIDCRQVLKMPDDNTQIMEMYCTDASGKENKAMEVRSTRM